MSAGRAGRVRRRADRRYGLAAVAVAGLLVLAGCSGGETGNGAATREPGAPANADSAAAVPVQAGRVTRDTLRIQVSAPGRTEVLVEETVRAPFTGTLVTLDVVDGDRVDADQTLGSMVSRSSEAALEGARAMLRSAATAADSADAREALNLARRDRVDRTLRAPSAGVVLSHAASPGDRLSEGDEILRIAAAGSAVFVAEVSQNDLVRMKPGRPARIHLAARADTLDGTVYGVLPAANSNAFSAPVRIDLRRGLETPAVGLFGTAIITVGERVDVLTVPADAVLTDDISGVSRVAVVRDGRARWVTVQPGITDRGRTEVSGPGLAPGQTVIVSGQVGLPDSAAVRVQP